MKFQQQCACCCFLDVPSSLRAVERMRPPVSGPSSARDLALPQLHLRERMRRLHTPLLKAALTMSSASARPLQLPGSAVATRLQAFRSWLLPPRSLDGAALEPPRLAVPAESDELSLEWTGVAEATSFALLASDWWAASESVSRTVYTGSALSAAVTERVMPGTPTSFVLVASDDSAELARSVAVTFSAAEAGACGNLADATVWRCVLTLTRRRRRVCRTPRLRPFAPRKRAALPCLCPLGGAAALTRLAASGTTGNTCTMTWRRAWRTAARRAARAPRRACKAGACCSANAAARAGTSCTTAQSTTALCRAASAQRGASATRARSRRAHRQSPSATGFQSGRGRHRRRDSGQTVHAAHCVVHRTQLALRASQASRAWHCVSCARAPCS